MDFKTGSLMYGLALMVVAFVIVQSVFFMRKAYKRSQEIGMEKAVVKQTIISSVLFTIAPAISILATVLALASALGIVLPWIRLSVIGNLAYETVAADTALSVLGSSLSQEVTDPQAFSTVMWAMTIGSCFPLILLPFLCKKIHKAMTKVMAGKKTEANEDGEKKKSGVNVGDLISAAAFIGIVAAFISRAVMGIEKDGVSAGFMSVAVMLSAMIFTIALDYLCKKKNLKKLEPFVLPIAMFGAMGIAILLTQVLPEEIINFVWRSINENGEVVWGVQS